MKFDKKLTTSEDINDATQLRFIPDSESVEALGRMPSNTAEIVGQ